MFSRKVKALKPAVAPTRPTRRWPRPDAKSQSLVMDVKEFEYTIRPRMNCDAAVDGTCKFQALSRTPGFEGVLVLGELETRDSAGNRPGAFTDYWKAVPEVIDGCASLVNADAENFHQSFFSITWFARRYAFASIIEAFSRGIALTRNGVSLDVHLVHPDHYGKTNYWDTDWRQDTWQLMFPDVTTRAT